MLIDAAWCLSFLAHYRFLGASVTEAQRAAEIAAKARAERVASWSVSGPTR